MNKVERAVGTVIDALAAGLVVIEIGLLFAGMASRYVMHRPLVWTDELAGMLFLWLAMLGAAVALRRGAHMCMTAFVSSATRRRAHVLSVGTHAVMGLFLVLLLPPAMALMLDDWDVVTPAMEVSNAWRLAAVPAGLGLMLLLTLFQLIRLVGWAGTLAVGAGVGAVAVAVMAAGPVLAVYGNLNLVLFFVVGVTACVFAGVPIGVAFGVATLAFLALATRVPLTVVVGRMAEGMSHAVLLAVPLFVFLGALIEMNGMARAMVRFLSSLIGHVRGGLSYVLLAAIYLVSGIAGSKAADMAAVAPVLFPEMRERGVPPGELVAILAASGAMSETIPPSLVLITIGTVTSVSIADLFTGGLLPGLVLALAMAVVVWLRARAEPPSGLVRPPARTIVRLLLVAAPVLALPVLIRWAVVGGIATATEVSTIGIAFSGIVGALLYRPVSGRQLWTALVATASLSGAILLIIGTATAMAWALTQSGFSRQLASAMTGLPGGAPMFMALSVVAFIVLGSLLEGIPAIVLFGPLLFPIAKTLHIHEVHYAIVVVLAMGIGLFAPPFGVGYYTACAIGAVNPAVGMRPILGYLLALTAGLVVVACVPWLSTGLLVR